MRSPLGATPLLKSVAVAAALLMVAKPTIGQSLQTSRVIWELASWPGIDTDNGAQTQLTSGEDWFYSITQSRTALGAQDGFVAAGYSTYPAVESTECRLSCNSEGCPFASIAKLSPGGEVEWFAHNGLEGSFWRVIDTSDGGFLAVGHTRDRALVGYNPDDGNPSGLSLECAAARLIIVAKYDHDGDETWQYAYGYMNDPDVAPEQTMQDNALAAVERPGGGYRVVGHAVDPAYNMSPRAFAMDLDEDGLLEESRVFGLPDTRSEFHGIAYADDYYFMVGTQYNGEYDDAPLPFGDVIVVRIGEDLTAVALTKQFMSTSDEQDMGYDIAVAGDGSVHVAFVEDCEPLGGHGNCFRSSAGGQGDGLVWRLDPDTLDKLSDHSLGEVRAYDLFVRLTTLSDGRVAVVTTKQYDAYLYDAWDNTDAYVRILNDDGSMYWQATHSARTSMPHEHYPTDRDTRQECLYDVAEAEDGGLVISGNNSSNYDDNYVVRFMIDSVPTLPAPTVEHAHLVYPQLGVSPNVVDLTGDLTIEPGARVYVDQGRTLAFEEDGKLIARDSLVATEATFTESVTDDGWGGIVVAEGMSTITGGRVEHATIGVKVYDPARVVIDGTELSANGTAVDVRSNTDGTQPGAVVDNAVISDNTTGVRTDFVDCYGTSCNCLTGCRGRVRVLDSVVEENGGTGIQALNGDVQVTNSCVRGNAFHGLTVANALVEPFTGNSVTQNGEEETAVCGAVVLSGGDLRLSPTDDVGENRLVANAEAELYVATGGAAFAGFASTSGGNAFVDADGGTLAYAPGHTTIYARYNWWGASPPPSGAFPGPGEVDRTSYLGSDPTTDVCDAPSEFSPRAGGPLPESFGGGEPGAALEELRVGIRRLRDSLMADPGGARAADVVRALYNLQRVDRADSLGERDATMSTLAALRARLGEQSLPAGLRAAAEAALEMEAADALTHERYAEARALLDAYAGGVSGEDVRRALTLTRAFLEAQAGRRADAAALVRQVAAGLEDEREGRELVKLAAALAEEAPGAAAWHGDAAVAANPDAAAGLAVVPNPSAGTTTIRLVLPAPTVVRLVVYDVLGRIVATLADGAVSQGAHSFRFGGEALPTGIYVVHATLEMDGMAPRAMATRLTLLR